MANDKNYMDKLSTKLDWVTAFQDVLLVFEKMINKNIHVGGVGIFKNTVSAYDSNRGYGIASVSPIPLEKGRESYNINAYYIADYSFNSDELVVILYSDLSFVENLNYDKKSQRETDDKNYHTQMNAIIIPAVKQGEPGESAYEVAVDNGFVGTEQQWLDSLVGPEGPEGPQGPPGVAPNYYKHFMKLVGSYGGGVDNFTVFVDILLTDSASYGDNSTWSTHTKLVNDAVYFIKGYYSTDTYEVMDYKSSGMAKFYKKASDFGTSAYTYISLNSFKITSDTVSMVK